MPLASGSGHAGSGGGVSRPGAVAGRSASGSSSSTVNRARPVPLRRATPAVPTSRVGTSSSSSRAHATTTSSAPAAAPSQSSLLSSIPKPCFPPADAFEKSTVDNALLQARLLQLARLYLSTSDATVDETSSCDLQSACFYAQLALQTDPSCLAARRLLATTLLHGAQPFPFGPSSVHSTSLSVKGSKAAQTSSSASISGAHAAIEILKEGTEDVFLDIGCARIFARASTVLGQVKEGKEALAWTLKKAAEESGSGRGSRSPSTSSRGADGSIITPPSLDSKNMEQAFVYSDLANLAARGNKYEEAKSSYLKAKKLDRWSWSAWTGLCDVGSDETISSIINGDAHNPKSFYSAQLESRLMGHGYDKEVVKKTVDELIARGEEYFSLSEGGAKKEEEGGVGGQPIQRTNSNKGVTSSTAAPSKTFSRPGTSADASSAATAGTKRVRTATSGSSTSTGTAPRPGVATAQNSRVAGNSAASDSHVSKRSAVSTVKGRPAATSQPSTAIKARAGGTLSAVRTNEQQRPNSSASGSSRGASDKDIIKPRRSLRVNVGGGDEPSSQQPEAPAAETLASSQKSGATTGKSALPSTGGQVRRTVPKTATATTAASNAETDSNAGTRKINPTRPGLVLESSNSRILTNIMQTTSFEAAKQAAMWNAVDKEVKELVQTLAMAYYAVKNYHSRSALILLRRRKALTNGERTELKRELGRELPIDSFVGLDDCYRNTFDVQCLIARAHHDAARYHLAEKHFWHARRLAPTSDAHMDIFSLTLFHLQREVALSRLARELNHLDENSCVSHIARGNAFALQQEHALALQSFQRACVAAPSCAYAFTLAGYEAYELGFKDRSLRYFRKAINIERRHWNAFAGLGHVYFESEHYASAAYYYSRAIALHKTNPVLWDVYGNVLSAQGKLEEAEEAFERAIRIDNTLAMSHIKMAEVLLLQAQSQPEKRDRAHGHLLEAVRYAPEEAHVHLMLAHTYMEKGKGSFARIDQGGKKRRTSGGTHVMPVLVPSELQQISAGSYPGSSNTARALGTSHLPQAFQAEIAKHLCAAIDLDPRCVRYVKAMGEGAKAALRGVVSRFAMDGNMGPDGSTLLADSTAMLDGQNVGSIVDLDGDQVLEDHTALTEELGSEEDEEDGDDDVGHEEEREGEMEEEEEGEGEDGDEEEDDGGHHGEEDGNDEDDDVEEGEDDEDRRGHGEMDASGSEGEEDGMEGAHDDSLDVENELEIPQRRQFLTSSPVAAARRRGRPAADQSDVSMSF